MNVSIWRIFLELLLCWKLTSFWLRNSRQIEVISPYLANECFTIYLFSILVKIDIFWLRNSRQIEAVLPCLASECFNLTNFFGTFILVENDTSWLCNFKKLLESLTYLTIIQLCFSFCNISHDFDRFSRNSPKKHRRRENIKILNVVNFLSSSLTWKVNNDWSVLFCINAPQVTLRLSRRVEFQGILRSKISIKNFEKKNRQINAVISKVLQTPLQFDKFFSPQNFFFRKHKQNNTLSKAVLV